MTRAITGKPKGKPRGRPFKPGNDANLKGRPKASETIRKQLQDARLLARDHSVEAVEKMIKLMREGETQQLQLMAAHMIVDRGYGRPPQALEVFGGDVRPEEREGSAIEFLRSRVALLNARGEEGSDLRQLN